MAKVPVGYVAVGLATAVIGYFAGREHLKYEMRNALQSAAEGIATGFGLKPTAEEATPEDQTKETSTPSQEERPKPIGAELISKGFHAADTHNNEYQDYITIGIRFENLTGQDLRAFDGIIVITDVLDNEIMAATASITDPIKAGASFRWDGTIDYNQFKPEHRKLRSVEKRDLKAIFRPRKLLFSDGTTQEFQ